MESALIVVTLLTVAIALTSSVTGKPTPEVAKSLNFGGGVDFAQKIGQTLTSPFKKTNPTDGERRTVSGSDAVTSGPVMPQSTAAADVQDPKPSSSKLETTTQSRFFVGSGSKCGPNQRVDPGTRACVDASAEPDDK